MGFESLDIRLHEIAANLDRQMPDIIAQAVMIELSAEHKERIFGRGLATDGTPMPGYSSEPGYYSKDKFIRKGAFKPLGKPNKEGKRNVNTTMFIQGGYSELREIQGRTTEVKNLKYSGSLEKNIVVGKFGNSTAYGNTDSAESDKFNGLEAEYEVFGLSISEREFINKEITDQAILVAKQGK